MNRRASLISLVLLSGAMAQAATFSDGVEAYKDHQWTQAMGAFLDVLHGDPRNELAHKYLDAIAQEIALERRDKVQHDRLFYLQGAAETLKTPNTSMATAIRSLTGSDDGQKEDRWHEKLEQARMHKDLGQLLPANDLVLQILAEKPDHREALVELSDLQSRLRKILDTGALLNLEERYAYEGFYAYGQADYGAASTAWRKARAIVEQNTTQENERKIHLQALCFMPYEKIAQAHVDEEKQQNDLLALFNQGVAAYDAERYEDALDALRRLALKDPDYPQLAFYLVQAETGADKMRSKRLGEEKRKEVLALYERGVELLEKEHFVEAENAFMRVLALDPSHSQARTYLAMAKAENERRHDPKAAQMHYEAGLIAYASGKLDTAVREWNMAIRMNPEHPKARIALAKVQKELALSREVPEAQ